MLGSGKPLGDPEAPGFGEEDHKHPMHPPMFGTDPADGLPRPTVQADYSVTAAPKLDPKTFICMADMSKFVIRNSQGDVIAEFEPYEVRRAANGSWHIVRDQLPPEDWEKLVMALQGPVVLGSFVAQGVATLTVEPIRPQCHHYRRQMVDYPGSDEHRFIGRSCMALRDENGEFVTLRDTRVYACELREPRHLESEALLDGFDAEAVAQTEREQTDFDLDAALSGAAPSGSNGIFG